MNSKKIEIRLDIKTKNNSCQMGNTHQYFTKVIYGGKHFEFKITCFSAILTV